METFESRPKLVDKRTGQEHTLLKESVILGRHRSADIVIPVVEVSRRHCRIWREEEVYFVEDMGTINGTYVNEEAVTTRMVLCHGFHLKVAKCTKHPGGVRNYVFRDPVGAHKQAEEAKAARERADLLAEFGTDSSTAMLKEKVKIKHCQFMIVRKKDAPRQIPLLKFTAKEVSFLNLFPFTRDEALTLVIEHPNWAETIRIGLKVQRITQIRNRPVFQVQASTVGFGKKQAELCGRLINTDGGLLKFFS